MAAGRKPNSYFYRATLVLTPAAASTARKVIRIFLVISLSAVRADGAQRRVAVRFVQAIRGQYRFRLRVRAAVRDLGEQHRDPQRGQGSVARSDHGRDRARGALFFLGATGDETSKLLGRYARNLSSVKLAGAELAFTPKERGDRDRLSSTSISGTSGDVCHRRFAGTADISRRSTASSRETTTI